MIRRLLLLFGLVAFVTLVAMIATTKSPSQNPKPRLADRDPAPPDSADSAAAAYRATLIESRRAEGVQHAREALRIAQDGGIINEYEPRDGYVKIGVGPLWYVLEFHDKESLAMCCAAAASNGNLQGYSVMIVDSRDHRELGYWRDGYLDLKH